MSSLSTFVAGADGCKDGWVIVSEACDGRVVVDVVPNFPQVLERRHQLVVVDIPIGLLDEGTRLADREARRLLKRRSCCVFTAPLRPMLTCSDYAEARKCRRTIEGKGLTKQAWAIMPKIREVDVLLTPERQSWVREGHPEVSFAQINNGEAVTLSKHTAEGRRERMSLLTKHFSTVASHVQMYSRIAEDIIDAYAMLWTASRIREGRAVASPEQSPRDSRGLLMQIWA
jgi:predicted RNase H-like nuclease